MKYISAALAILPTVALAACINDQTYTIGYASASYSCSDLELTSNEATRAYLCTASPATVTRCPHACGTCCEDSSFYKFDMINIIAEQPCSWISKNPKKIDIRRGRYCNGYASNTYVVKDMCQVACDNCYGLPSPTPQPTPLVTPAPTPAPTPPPANDGSPSSQPTRPPSPLPSPFPTLSPSSQPSASPFDKPSVSPSDSPTKYPSIKPSNVPSIVPSDEPSKHPTSSIKPSAKPSASPVVVGPTPSPTPNPTPGPTPAPVAPTACADGTGSFVIDTTGALKTCDWLVENSTITEARKNDYCGRSTVANLCKSSCGYCSCTDSATYQWPLINTITPKLGSCAWLTRNTDPVKLANRKNNYCTYGFQKGSVSYNCPVACGTFACA